MHTRSRDSAASRVLARFTTIAVTVVCAVAVLGCQLGSDPHTAYVDNETANVVQVIEDVTTPDGTSVESSEDEVPPMSSRLVENLSIDGRLRLLRQGCVEFFSVGETADINTHFVIGKVVTVTHEAMSYEARNKYPPARANDDCLPQ